MLYLLLFIIIIIYLKTIYIESFDSELEFTKLKNQLKDGVYSKPGPKGDKGNKGDRGRTGQRGKSGSKYLNNGMIRNVGNPNYVTERLYGNGNLFMSEPKYVSFQEFMHEENGNIINKFDGKCLTKTAEREVKMMDCKKNASNQKWFHNNLNQLQIGNQCLIHDNNVITGLVNQSLSQNYKPCRGKNCKINSQFLTLTECDTGENKDMQWTFY